LNPNGIVLVATIRALKMHGGVAKTQLQKEDVAAVKEGLSNLDKHVENVRFFGKPCVVALNKFATDSDEEIEVVRQHCAELGVEFAVSDHHGQGGKGAIDLAQAVIKVADQDSSPYKPVYQLEQTIEEKVEAVTKTIYGAEHVNFTAAAKRQIARAVELGYSDLPVCIAKVPGSLSDDARRYGRPRGFEITVRGIQIDAGAGFVVILTGNIFRMPGLPRRPLAMDIDMTENGEIVGIE